MAGLVSHARRAILSVRTGTRPALQRWRASLNPVAFSMSVRISKFPQNCLRVFIYKGHSALTGISAWSVTYNIRKQPNRYCSIDNDKRHHDSDIDSVAPLNMDCSTPPHAWGGASPASTSTHSGMRRAQPRPVVGSARISLQSVTLSYME